MTERDLVRAVLDEWAAVSAAMVGGEPVIETEDEGLSAVWALNMDVVGTLDGPVTLGVTAEDAARLAGLVMGFDEPPGDDIVTDTLQELAQQIASAVTVKYGPELKVAVSGAITSLPSAPGGAAWSAVVLGDLRTRVALWHDLTPARQAAAPVATPTPDLPAQAAVVRQPAAAPPLPPSNMELILDIELPLWVRFGETAMTLQALTKLGPGTTLDLERSPDDPVDVMVNSTVIARGEVVVVAGNYGVRVTEVVSASDRIRSMAG
ncbi:MAG: FliM/FliN family flagellar motor switch protein [Vicinamibacterales bacterium]|nr:FliM/FliN family flagellar motor switch protein [Vicinamibacterales bacterium]